MRMRARILLTPRALLAPPCPCTRGLRFCWVGVGHPYGEIAAWQTSSCSKRPHTRGASDPPAPHRQRLAMVQRLSRLPGAVCMGTMAGSSISSSNTSFALMPALVIKVHVVEVPRKPQMPWGGAMVVPHNSPEPVANLGLSVPSLWGCWGTICPICRQRAESSLGQLARDQTSHRGRRNRPSRTPPQQYPHPPSLLSSTPPA